MRDVGMDAGATIAGRPMEQVRADRDVGPRGRHNWIIPNGLECRMTNVERRMAMASSADTRRACFRPADRGQSSRLPPWRRRSAFEYSGAARAGGRRPLDCPAGVGWGG